MTMNCTWSYKMNPLIVGKLYKVLENHTIWGRERFVYNDILKTNEIFLVTSGDLEGTAYGEHGDIVRKIQILYKDIVGYIIFYDKDIKRDFKEL